MSLNSVADTLPEPHAAPHRPAKVLGSVVSILGSEILSNTLLFAFFLIVGKLVSTDELGRFAFATATAAFIPIAVNFGLRLILIRGVAEDRSRCGPLVETILWQRLVFMVAAVSALLLLTFMVPRLAPLRVELMLAALASCMLMLTDLGIAICEGLERMHWVPALHATEGSLRVLLLALLFFVAPKASIILALICTSQTITALAALACATRIIGRVPIPRRHPGVLAHSLRQGYPLALLAIAGRTHARFDWLFIGLIANSSVLASYSVGYRIYEGLNLFGPALLRGTFPRLTQSVAGGHEVFTGRLAALTKALLLINTLIASTTILHVHHVLRLYDERYLDGTYPAMILLSALPPLAIVSCLHVAFLAKSMQRFMLLDGVLLACLNILINIWAIPTYGTIGAACATAFPYFVSACFTSFLFARHVGPFSKSFRLLPCILPAVPTVIAGYYLTEHYPTWWIGTALLQALIFLGTAYVLRVFTVVEQEWLGRAFRLRV